MDHIVPPLIKLVIMKEAVITRWSVSGRLAGKAFKLLENARRGFLSDTVETSYWNHADVGCVVCGKEDAESSGWIGFSYAWMPMFVMTAE